MVQGSGSWFRVQGSGFKVWVLGYSVQVVGFRGRTTSFLRKSVVYSCIFGRFAIWWRVQGLGFSPVGVIISATFKSNTQHLFMKSLRALPNRWHRETWTINHKPWSPHHTPSEAVAVQSS